MKPDPILMSLVRRPFPPLSGPTPGLIEHLQNKMADLLGEFTIEGDPDQPLTPILKLLEKPEMPG